jgi:hypothetical protein
MRLCQKADEKKKKLTSTSHLFTICTQAAIFQTLAFQKTPLSFV